MNLKNVENKKNNPTAIATTNLEIINKDFLEELEEEFSYSIRERGKEYYERGNVISCYKSNNKYYAKVRGTEDKPYVVKIEISDEENIDYSCTCPCEFPCKHEYAVLITISNQETQTIELKEEVKEKKLSLQTILKNIPAEKIKEYLLSPKGMDHVCFEMTSFEDYFRKYFPEQPYEYFYNNLFNSLVLDDYGEYTKLLDSYINKIKQYISNATFKESYKIVKSIIEAYNDTNLLNLDEHIIDLFPNIGMYLRVSYRKSNPSLKKEIKKWFTDIKSKNYYNNVYLEDILITLE